MSPEPGERPEERSEARRCSSAVSSISTCGIGRGGKRRSRHHFDGLGKELEKLTYHGIGIKADRESVRTDECLPENSGRPMRHIVALERFEQRLLNLGLFGDLGQGNLLLFT